ncbi:hypothetical protein N665_1862s0015 [Sinapis alba]|nr:hypothetical protein N665_1862s0015 [Sinapis alba]
MAYPENRSVFWNVSVHGMICSTISLTLEVWNPTIRRTVTLPHPQRGWSNMSCFLGFDPIDATYKVLSMPRYPYSTKGDKRPRVLTLTGDHHDQSWRVIQEIPEHVPYCPGQHIINGFIYYLASLKPHSNDYILVSFHVRSEKMSMIKVPWYHIYIDTPNIFPVLYQGKLACVISLPNDIRIWILEDAEKHEWSYKNFHQPFPRYDEVSQGFLELRGFNDAGELIYLPSRLVDPVQILYFDPNTDSYRSVVVEGLVDDQFRRRNGIGENDILRTLAVYSNHIETLMSL